MDTNSPDQDVLDAAKRELQHEANTSSGAFKLFGIIAVLTVLGIVSWIGWQGYSSKNMVAAPPQPAVQVGAVPETPAIAPADETASGHDDHDVNPAAPAAEAEGAHHKHFEADGALVTNHEIALFLETQEAGGVSPSERAEVVTQRLNDTAESTGLDPKNIQARIVNDLPTVFYAKPDSEGYVLATIDPQTAAQFGFANDPAILALWWRDVLRDHSCIIAGNPPIYTTPYSSILQRVYSLCQAEQKGVPTHESFETAIGKLSRDEHDALQGLYVQVPANYRPQRD